MPVHDDLGKRIKENYESVTKTKLVRRMPVIIRIDGKAFHTFTKGFKRPFDDILFKCMNDTMQYLCENIQGCKLGYCQSDEISLLLTDYDKLNTSAWFDNEVLKMTSISASMATLAFNKALYKWINAYEVCKDEKWESDKDKYYQFLLRAYTSGALFDSRVFNIPKEEVTNYFLWRQNDATRNSIESVGQAYFSAKELHKKTCNMIQDMLFKYKGINWNDFSTDKKRGRCCIKQKYWVDISTHEEVDDMPVFDTPDDAFDWGDNFVQRSRWVVDNNIPIFVNEGRDYIEKLVHING